MVVEVGYSLEGVAEGEVADVVQQRGGSRYGVVRCEVGGQGEQAQLVFQPGVGLVRGQSGCSGMDDELEAPYGPGTQQPFFQRAELDGDVPHGVAVVATAAENAAHGQRARIQQRTPFSQTRQPAW